MAEGDLHFYPAAVPSRAVRGEYQELAQPFTTLPCESGTIADQLAEHATALGADPWLRSRPMLLTAVSPTFGAGHWCLAEADGTAIPLATSLEVPWRLIGLSGGHPLTVAGEWTAAGLIPIAALANGEIIDVEPESPLGTPVPETVVPAAAAAIVPTALLGTARRPLDRDRLPEAVTAALRPAEPEHILLDAAMAQELYHAAESRPDTRGRSRPRHRTIGRCCPPPRPSVCADWWRAVLRCSRNGSPQRLVRHLDLDLRKERDVARSHLLHRLALLGIGWGTRVSGEVRNAGTFRESWSLRWEPGLSVAVIEASRWGTTVRAAAEATILDRVRAAEVMVADVGAALECALLADLGGAVDGLVARLAEVAALDHDVTHLLAALPSLIRTLRYGDVRSTDVEALGRVADGLLIRVCAGLPGAVTGVDADAAAQLRGLIDDTHVAIATRDDPHATATWTEALRRLADRDDVHGTLVGRAARLLCDAGIISGEESARRMSAALSTGPDPADKAAWIDGFLGGRGLLLVHDRELLARTDSWLRELDESRFGTQLGGGTDINRAVAYCGQLITRPADSLFILISDLYEGGVRDELLRRVATMKEAGVQVLVLLALSDEGAPAYDHDNAAALAALGVPAFACTPDRFPDLLSTALDRGDVFAWAGAPANRR